MKPDSFLPEASSELPRPDSEASRDASSSAPASARKSVGSANIPLATYLGILLLGLFLAAAFGLEFKLRGFPAPAKKIDLRPGKDRVVNQNDPSERYLLLVVAWGTQRLGHISVSWLELVPGEPAPRSSAFGFYADEFKLGRGVWHGVSGKLWNESDLAAKVSGASSDGSSIVSRYALVLVLSEEQFRRTSELREKWSSPQEYVLIQHDCVSFLEDIARTLELKTPKRWLAPSPQLYVSTLLEINP